MRAGFHPLFQSPTQTLSQAIDEFGDHSQWALYQLDKDLLQVQDYLACLMTALINEAVYTLENYMNEQLLASYSTAVNGMVNHIYDECGKLNCTH